MALAHDPPAGKTDQRIIALDDSGKVYNSSHDKRSGTAHLEQYHVQFKGLKLDEIAAFEFQTRPFEWVRFKNVSLIRGQKITVRVLDRKTNVEIQLARQARSSEFSATNDKALEPTGRSNDSAQRLERVGLAFALYSADHNNQFPQSLEQLQPYLTDDDLFEWATHNVACQIRSETFETIAHAVAPLAFDKDLLVRTASTTVLLFDDWHVQQVTSAELQRLGLDKQMVPIVIETLLQQWYRSCMILDMEPLQKTYVPEYALAVRDARDLKAIMGQGGDPDWDFDLILVLWDEDEALVISGEIRHSDSKSVSTVLVWTLKNHESQGKINDIDLEDIEGLQGENVRFLQRHPGARTFIAK